MYEPNNLYDEYVKRSLNLEFSPDLPDITKKTTLRGINSAINLCQRWDSTMDIGCGNGHYLSSLSGKFRNNIGVEIDSYPEQKELEKRHGNIKFFNGKIEDYPETEKFDFILLMDIFEHIPDIEAFISKISLLQKDGGIVYITTPNPIYCSPAEESNISAKKTGYHGHIKHYTKREICDLITEAGYQEEFFFYEESPSREEMRRIVKGISRRDKALSKRLPYRFVRPIVLLFLKPLFYIIGAINMHIETANRNNRFDMRSLSIAFKKNT